MKTYVLTVSKVFPKTHKKAGKETFFKEQILTAQMNYEKGHGLKEKIHTIRANYDLWKKRIDLVNEGKAILSLRYWTGSPYNYQRDGSKQQEFLQLKKGECGIQKLGFSSGKFLYPYIENDAIMPGGLNDALAKNDGLLYDDFEEWFKEYDLNEPMAIIHFTGFRY